MLSNDFTLKPAWELASLVRTGKLSPVELTRHFLDRIEAHDGTLNAFLTVAGEQAIADARRAEEAVASGAPLGPLHGVPIGIKDLNLTKGLCTTYGSLLHKDRVPDRDDITVERIRAAGAIIAGKTNTPEFGWKGTTENLLGEPCRNPWDRARTSGGSSGGSAAAVSARLVPIATGSDAGGSIRIPASFCGVYGIKPTFGRVPSDYEGPGGWRALSQNGPIANNVRDAALLLTVLSGPDGRDATCIRTPSPDFTDAIEHAEVRGLRVAWSPDLGDRPVDPLVRAAAAAAAQAFEEMGATVEEAAPPVDIERLIEVFMVLMLTDMAIGLGPVLDAGRGPLMTPTLVEWVAEASTWPATRYAAALRDLEWHRRSFAAFFERFDLLLTPTMAVPAFPIEEFPSEIDGHEVDPRWGFTPFCIHANLTGQPAATVPCGSTPEGLPVGLQIIGHLADEEMVLRASAAFEVARPWAGRLPRSAAAE